MAKVDKADRLRDIYDAAFEILARGGFSALTLRELADALGGSMTLVTHYFPTQNDLMHGVLEHQFERFDDELETLAIGEEPAQRLRTLAEWFLPLDDESWNLERARVLLAIRSESDDEWMRPHLNRIDARMRSHLRDALRPLVGPTDLDLAVDMLRMVLNGIVLSAVEHRGHWTAERQLAVLDRLWATLPWKEHRAPGA